MRATAFGMVIQQLEARIENNFHFSERNDRRCNDIVMGYRITFAGCS